MNAFHTSTEQLAGVFKKVNPKVTVIYLRNSHARGCDRPRASCQEIKKFGYDGVVVQSQDGDIFS